MPTRDYILGDVRDDSVMIAFRMAMPDAERQRVLQVPSILAGFLRRCCKELADAIQRAHGQ